MNTLTRTGTAAGLSLLLAVAFGTLTSGPRAQSAPAAQSASSSAPTITALKAARVFDGKGTTSIDAR